MSPAGRQPALGQDQHQRAEPQRLRQRGIIEPDTNAGLSQSQPQAQEKEQSRQADSVRHPCRYDRREHHHGADQQDETKINGRHGRLRIVRSQGLTLLATSLRGQRPQAERSALQPQQPLTSTSARMQSSHPCRGSVS
jgi:hypothetical protein